MSLRFPKGFIFGTATASYQIEGAAKEDGKGESIWDRFTATPGTISDGSSGLEACDHYHRYGDDVALMQQLGLDAYRFSVSWPRILPEGTGRVEERGLDFYSRLVDQLLSAGITPFVTLYHWDLPQVLQDRGGWENRDISAWFTEYVSHVVARLGDRVKHWITLNEPFVIAFLGNFTGEHAPGKKNRRAAFRVTHNLHRAHGAAVDAIRGQHPEAKVGITHAVSPVHPASPRDLNAARRGDALMNRIFLDPLFGKGYPEGVERLINSANPDRRPDDLELASRPVDFVGLNNYTRQIARRTLLPIPGFRFLDRSVAESEYTEMGWEVYPRGLAELCYRMRDEYGNPPVYITENGAAFPDRVEGDRVADKRRIAFLEAYLTELAGAAAAGCDVRGYFVWSFMDNFEWAHGYSKRFGIVYVDYESQRRILKDSGRWYADLIAAGKNPS